MNQSFQVVSREVPTEDPFLDLDRDEDVLVEDEETQDLITQLAIENSCTISELALADDDLAVCADFSDDQWEGFLAEICPSSSKVSCTEDTSENSDVDSESEEMLIYHLNFKIYLRLLYALKMSISSWNSKDILVKQQELSLISSLTTLHSVNLSKAKRQTSLLEYFAETS